MCARRSVVEIDARHRSFGAFEHDVLHLLHVDLFALDRIEHGRQHAGTIQMTNDQPMRCRSLPREVYNVRNFSRFLKLAHDPDRLRGNRFLRLIG